MESILNLIHFFLKNFYGCEKRDINLNIGIGDKKGKQDFYIISSRSLNTFSRKEARKYEKVDNFRFDEIIKVEVNTLKNVLKNFANNKFQT